MTATWFTSTEMYSATLLAGRDVRAHDVLGVELDGQLREVRRHLDLAADVGVGFREPAGEHLLADLEVGGGLEIGNIRG